jgi:hypothetical protein
MTEREREIATDEKRELEEFEREDILFDVCFCFTFFVVAMAELGTGTDMDVATCVDCRLKSAEVVSGNRASVEDAAVATNVGDGEIATRE